MIKNFLGGVLACLGFNVPRLRINKRFYSTSLPFPNKLIINSTTDNIVFTRHNNIEKSVLFLPSLKPFLHLIENSSSKSDFTIYSNEKFRNLLLEFKDFNLSFVQVINSLDNGYYTIEFYFYIEDLYNVHNAITEVYTLDFFDKEQKCLNKVYGSIGYTNFAYFMEYFEDSIEFKDLYYLSANYLITKRLREILENKKSKSIINFNKDTLVVITKSSQQEYDQGPSNIENRKINIPGIKINVVKRFYSNSSHFTDKFIKNNTGNNKCFNNHKRFFSAQA